MGPVIAQSNEAKSIGIKPGIFKIKAISNPSLEMERRPMGKISSSGLFLNEVALY